MKDSQIKYLPNTEIERKYVEDFIEQWKLPHDTIVISTSGSTGKPKEIEINKEKMIVSAQQTLNALSITPNSTALLCLNISNVGGKMMIVRSIVGELKLIIAPISSNPLTELNEQIDFCAMVPLQVETCLNETPEKFKYIKKLIIGGAPVSSSLEKQLLDIPTECFHTFGMTETISHVALRNISKQENFFKSVGDTEFQAINNQLVISSNNLGIQQLKTNDIVELLSPKSFIWKGRADFVINSGGVKLHPEEIENNLESVIDNNFFVTGVGDDKLGQKLVLIIEGNEQPEINIKIQELGLPKYSFPKEIKFLSHFVYTTSGKINRGKTLEKLLD